VQKPHCEPWCSTIDRWTGLQLTVRRLQTFNSNELLAVNRRQKTDAGIYGVVADTPTIRRELTQHDCAGAAVALGTAFLRPRPSGHFAQIFQNGGGRR